MDPGSKCGSLRGLTEQLVSAVPRLAVGEGLIWADARGLDAVRTAERLYAIAAVADARVQVGVAHTPVVAEVAARTASESQPIQHAPEAERAFLAELPLSVLSIAQPLRVLLSGVGIESCGQLAALEREAIEVRFGPELIGIWQRARGQDERRVFSPVPAVPPHASIDFVDYVVSDAERLIFSVNALLGGICDGLHAHGRHARRLRVVLSLVNGERWERVLRPARPSASRTVWLRLTRAVLERITIADAVNGITVDVDGTETATAVQGDLFDVGFATSSAVDLALARLIEAQGEVLVQPETTEHPVPEIRTRFIAETPAAYLDKPATFEPPAQMGALTLQLLKEPRVVLVETVRRRDHVVPIRYRDGVWKQLVTAAGPDRVSGGRWEEPYAREYFRAVGVDGMLVWLYRDARTDTWYLHGYWD